MRRRLFTFFSALSLLLCLALCGLCRAYRRSHRGTCSRCAYDLRATPDRCPECGRAAGKEAA